MRKVVAVDTIDDGGSFRIEADGVTSPSCIGGDNQVGVEIFSADELLFQEFVTPGPCNHLE